MKYWIFSLLFLSFYSCKQKPIEKTIENTNSTHNMQITTRNAYLNILNDSIHQLMNEFHKTDDSSKLALALPLSKKVLSLDTCRVNQIHQLNTQIQILALLNKKKEAFLLKEETLNKDPNNIDRLIYMGKKKALMQQQDSATIYYSKALSKCNKILKRENSTDIIIKKVEIYFYQNKKDEAKKIIDNALIDYPDNEIINIFHENFDEYYQISEDVFRDLRL